MFSYVFLCKCVCVYCNEWKLKYKCYVIETHIKNIYKSETLLPYSALTMLQYGILYVKIYYQKKIPK